MEDDTQTQEEHDFLGIYRFIQKCLKQKMKETQKNAPVVTVPKNDRGEKENPTRQSRKSSAPLLLPQNNHLPEVNDATS